MTDPTQLDPLDDLIDPEAEREQLARLSEIGAALLRPPPDMTVSEWADTYRMLDSRSAHPGKWHTDRLPHMREPMDRLSLSDPCSVVVCKFWFVGGLERRIEESFTPPSSLRHSSDSLSRRVDSAALKRLRLARG